MAYNLQLACELERDFNELVLKSENDYNKYIVDMSEELKPIEFLFSIGYQSTVPAGEVIAVKGRAKMGKSQFELCLIAAALCGEFGSIKRNNPINKILLFDTEQSKQSVKTCVMRAFNAAGLPTDKNDERLKVFSLRPLSCDERRRVIEDAVRTEMPQLVFIDGVRDLLRDFNNLDESGEVIGWLLKLCNDIGCTIINVLHQNKSKEDSSMRGHLGSELLNKVSDCFEVTKKDGVFTVECTDSRNIPAPSFSFSLDMGGILHAERTVSKEEQKKNTISSVVSGIFEGKDTMTYSELCRSYAVAGDFCESKAKKDIAYLKNIGIIKGNRYNGYELS